MSEETQQEAELSKQAIHFSSEIDRLRTSNKELSDIIVKYRSILDRATNPPVVVEHLDFKALHEKALDKLMGFNKIFSQLYWYKGSP